MAKTFTKILCLVLSLMMVVALFAGCTKAPAEEKPAEDAKPAEDEKEEEPAAPTKIEEVWFFSSVGAYMDLENELIDAWNADAGAAAGAKIKCETNIDTYTTALETMLNSGTFPDLFDSDNNIPTRALKGWIMPLDQFKDNELKDEFERFGPYLKNVFNQYEGKTYNFPLEVLPFKMYYNADLFKAAGIVDASGEPTPPETWADVIEYAKKITEAGKGDFYGVGYTFGGWPAGGFERLLADSFIPSNGRIWYDYANDKYDFSIISNALEYIMQIKADGSYFPGPETIQIDPVRAQFSDGKIGMFISPSYDITVFNVQFPTTQDIRVCDTPVWDANTRYAETYLLRTNVTIGSQVAEDRIPAVLAAFKFINSQEYLSACAEAGAIIPIEPEVLATLSDKPELKGLAEYRATVEEGRCSVFYPKPDNLLPFEGDTHYTVFGNVWAGTMTPQEFIDDCNTRYNAALEAGVADGIVNLADYHVDDYALKLK